MAFVPLDIPGNEIGSSNTSGSAPTDTKATPKKVMGVFSPPGGKNITSDFSSTMGALKDVGKASLDALPTIGAVIGGIGGAMGGGALAAPTVVGAPAGAYAGGVAGAGVGGGAGQFLEDSIKKGLGMSTEGPSVGKTAHTAADYATIEAVAGPVASVAGKVLEGVGSKLAKLVIPTSKVEAKLVQNYKAGTTFLGRLGSLLTGTVSKIAPPVTAGATAFEKGLMGSQSAIGVQAKRAQATLWDKILAPALKAAPTKIDMPAFMKELETKIVGKNPELSIQGDLKLALQSLKDDYARAGKVDLAKLQEFKKGWAQKVPDKAYQGKPIGASLNNVKNEAASLAREKIYNALGPDVKQAYLDYGNLTGLTELGQTAMTGSKLKGGAGSFVHGIWDMATVPAGTIGGQTVYKVGQGVEFLGTPGAKSLRALLGIPVENNPQGAPNTTGQSPSPFVPLDLTGGPAI